MERSQKLDVHMLRAAPYPLSLNGDARTGLPSTESEGPPSIESRSGALDSPPLALACRS